MRTVLARLTGIFRKIGIWRLFRVGGVRGSITLANLAVFALLGHLYGTAAIGEFASYLAFTTLAGSLVSAGFPQMLMRRAALIDVRSFARLKRWRSAFWFGALLAALVASPASVALVWVLRSKAEIDLPWIAAIGPVVFSLNLLLSEEMRGRGKAELSLFITNFATILAPLGYLAVSILLPAHEVLTALVLTHIVSGLGLVMIFMSTSTRVDLSASRALALLKAMSPVDLASMALMRVFSGGASHVMVLLAAGLGSPVLAGFVAVAARLAGLAATFTGIVNASFARRVGAAQKFPDQLKALFALTATISFAGVGVLMLPILLFPDLFLALFAVSPELANAGLGLQILAGARIVRALAGVSDLFLLVLGRAYVELFATIASFVTLVGAIYLLPTTPLGAAISLSVSVLVHGVTSASGAWYLIARGRSPAHG